MKAVAILKGWADGSWHTKKFQSELIKRKFSITNDVDNADIIIAHSLGCFFVPKSFNAKLIVLINVPYWPNKSILTCTRQSIKTKIKDGKQHPRHWRSRLLHQTYYAITDIPRTLRYVKKRWEIELPEKKPGTSIVLVRNKEDPFCHPDIQEILPVTRKYKYVKLPKGHDDCWMNPKPYVDLLLKEL